MTGKEKCELLKAIRKNIAEMNGIEYYPEQCDHEGTCPGFCPRCDMEASYLMKELRKKEAAGSPIRIDTESLAQFETLTSEPIEEEDDDCIVGDIRTPGIIAPPEELCLCKVMLLCQKTLKKIRSQKQKVKKMNLWKNLLMESNCLKKIERLLTACVVDAAVMIPLWQQARG